jgi:hypothetical protein
MGLQLFALEKSFRSDREILFGRELLKPLAALYDTLGLSTRKVFFPLHPIKFT